MADLDRIRQKVAWLTSPEGNTYKVVCIENGKAWLAYDGPGPALPDVIVTKAQLRDDGWTVSDRRKEVTEQCQLVWNPTLSEWILFRGAQKLSLVADRHKVEGMKVFELPSV